MSYTIKSKKLMNLLLYGNEVTQMKMSLWIMFIVSLILMDGMSSLLNQIGLTYFIALLFIMLKSFLLVLIIVPSIGIKVIPQFIAVMVKHEMKTPPTNLEGIFTASILGSLVLVVITDWINSFTQGINPFWTAVSISTLMIIVSAFGTHFQMRLFFNSVISNNAKSLKFTYIFLAVFYGVMVINMGIINTIEKNTREIKKTQKKMFGFNKSVQELFN